MYGAAGWGHVPGNPATEGLVAKYRKHEREQRLANRGKNRRLHKAGKSNGKKV